MIPGVYSKKANQILEDMVQRLAVPKEQLVNAIRNMLESVPQWIIDLGKELKQEPKPEPGQLAIVNRARRYRELRVPTQPMMSQRQYTPGRRHRG